MIHKGYEKAHLDTLGGFTKLANSLPALGFSEAEDV
jgi:hypothetical protein